MKTNLKYFKTKDFHSALRIFFKNLNIPVNYIAEESARPKDILTGTYKADREAFQLMNDVYFLGMVDDATFEGGKSLDHRKIESDYDGILIFGVTLLTRQNDLPPTRTQLAEITRAFNREFHYTPVIVVFRYANALAFANAERLQYKQKWREGEKAGKVSLLRDIDLDRTHRGHLDILEKLAISRSGKQMVNSFGELYAHWQTVFNVSLLNKKFYEELSNWYFWAIKEVKFPGEPTMHTLFEETGSTDEKKLKELRQEHNAKNVIRLLTRFLFVWFIKEKKLIPTELFDLDYVKNKLVKDLSPYHQDGLFQLLNTESHYYKAILQNLFFATLNQEMGKRDFRKDKQHRNVTNLLRYKFLFKKPQKFIDLVESAVPFMNGGLFECLDKPHPTKKGPRGGEVIVYEDGFSDRNDNPLVVPDYLFFGLNEEVDLSQVIGIANKKTKKAAVKGLINIFDSYKFTITENTPIEEDIALDPELLGKVFENLLASYNPETKTTARKLTGSFYTPREIVNYMVDESIIAFLKNAVEDWGAEDDKLEAWLRELLSFDPGNPFAGNDRLQKEIIKAIDNCTILDPACGSGAFPMGVLQKMVHVLQKLDIDNAHWHELQMDKALKETESTFHILDKEAREQKLLEINEAFDEQMNDPDYARKLFLVENCIYGVDIQPIAAQISKLRFFISLVVDQKVDTSKVNFGIRPLPNLETKFVAANTLIGIEKKENQRNLFDNQEIKVLEKDLKKVRHRIFSAKTPKKKRELREEDLALRRKMGELLISDGWANETARKLAAWDPYDQNASAPFFDQEWMFGLKDGFDVAIGNPPYIKEDVDRKAFTVIKGGPYYQGKMDIWYAFACTCIDMLKHGGHLVFIATNNWITNDGASILRNKIITENYLKQLVDFYSFMIFESASIQTMVMVVQNKKTEIHKIDYRRIGREKSDINDVLDLLNIIQSDNNIIEKITLKGGDWRDKPLNFNSQKIENILHHIQTKANFNIHKKEVSSGIDILQDFLNKKNRDALGKGYTIGQGIFNLSDEEKESLNLNVKEAGLVKPFYTTKELSKFAGDPKNTTWVIYTDSSFKNINKINSYPNIKKHLDKFEKIITSVNRPYGLHRARNEYFFQGEKIFALRKCSEPSFTYTDFDCYVSRAFISIKTKRIDQKYLVGILNSPVIRFWLRFRGKMQGDQFQIDVNPILSIPVFFSEIFVNTIRDLVSLVIYAKNIENTGHLLTFTKCLDASICELYFSKHMKEKQIEVIKFIENDNKEILGGLSFDHLGDHKKKEISNQLHSRWTHPDSEVRNRIKLFAVRSPDILEPILDLK